MSVEIANVVDGWPYDAIRANWEANKARWQPTTEDFYYDQLGAVPPVQMGNGAFMLGEIADHTEHGEMRCGCIAVNGKYYAKFCYIWQFRADCIALQGFLKTETPT